MIQISPQFFILSAITGIVIPETKAKPGPVVVTFGSQRFETKVWELRGVWLIITMVDTHQYLP
jgi:hypothetical protein